MLIESIAKQIVKNHEDIKNGKFNSEELTKVQNRLTYDTRFLSSETITSLLKLKYGKEYPSPLINYLAVYAEDMDNEVIGVKDLIVQTESDEDSLIGDQMIYIPEHVKTMLFEIKYNSLMIRASININGTSTFYLIHLPVSSRELVVQEPVVIHDSEDILNTYISPVIKEDGSLGFKSYIKEQ